MPMSQAPGDSVVLVGKMEKPHIGALLCLSIQDSPSWGKQLPIFGEFPVSHSMQY